MDMSLQPKFSAMLQRSGVKYSNGMFALMILGCIHSPFLWVNGAFWAVTVHLCVIIIILFAQDLIQVVFT
jgi:hypothetical protein